MGRLPVPRLAAGWQKLWRSGPRYVHQKGTTRPALWHKPEVDACSQLVDTHTNVQLDALRRPRTARADPGDPRKRPASPAPTPEANAQLCTDPGWLCRPIGLELGKATPHLDYSVPRSGSQAGRGSELAAQPDDATDTPAPPPEEPPVEESEPPTEPGSPSPIPAPRKTFSDGGLARLSKTMRLF